MNARFERRPGRGAPAATAWALGALACSFGGCTLALFTDKKQCDTTADCALLGADFAATSCSAGGLCVPNASTGFCATNKECVDRNAGAPYVCRKADNVCVALRSEDCDLIGDPADAANDNAIVFGSLTALSGPVAFLGKGGRYAVELALDSFENAGGLPPTTLGGPPRPVLFVSCDDQVDARRAAEHLVNEVGVPAFIGPVTSPSVLDVFQNVALPKRALEIAPVASTVLLKGITGKELLFRTAAVDEPQAIVTNEVVAKFAEPWVRQRLGLAAADQVKLAVLRRSDNLGDGLGALLFQKIAFNNKNIADNGPNFRELDYGESPSDMAAQGAAVGAAVAFAPHVVVIVGTPESSGIMAQLEGAWREPAYRPQYILPPPAAGANYNVLVGANEDLRRRVLVINNFPDNADPRYARFLNLYNSNSTFREDATTTAVNNSLAVTMFDNAMMLLFATAALKERPVTGDNLAQAMAQLTPPGQAIDIQSATYIQDALNALGRGERVDYQGVSGPVDFDATGDAFQRLQILCLVPDSMGTLRTFQGGPGGYAADLTKLTLEGDFKPECALP